MDYKELFSQSNKLIVKQQWEGMEIVLGWESRNKYRIMTEDKREVGFAAEQSKGITGTILRQILGHWRSFKIYVFAQTREQVLELDFPFRWFFKHLSIKTPQGLLLGSLEQRFALLYKKFDVLDGHGRIMASIKSPLWKMWTFELVQGNQRLGTVKKKWTGILGEVFTDKDNFEITFEDPALTAELKSVMLGACLMMDIVYFENNHKRN